MIATAINFPTRPSGLGGNLQPRLGVPPPVSGPGEGPDPLLGDAALIHY